METHRVEPHLVDVVAVLVSRQLDAPFSTILVCLILPCGNDTLLYARLALKVKLHKGLACLEEVIVGLLRQFRRRDNVVIQAAMALSVAACNSQDRCPPPELFDAVEADDSLDVLHPALGGSDARCCRSRGRRECRDGGLRKVTALSGWGVEPKGPGRVKWVLRRVSNCKARERPKRDRYLDVEISRVTEDSPDALCLRLHVHFLDLSCLARIRLISQSCVHCRGRRHIERCRKSRCLARG